MESLENMEEEFDKQVQNMNDRFERKKQENREAFESRSGENNITYGTIATRDHQSFQSTRSDYTSINQIMPVLIPSIIAFIIILTILLRIRNKRKQEKAREEYKKYDEEMYRAHKDNAGIPDKDIIKARTADQFKDGISELLKNGDI